MDLDAPDLKKCLQALKEIDFELAYLVLLTRQGLKPNREEQRPRNKLGGSLNVRLMIL